MNLLTPEEYIRIYKETSTRKPKEVWIYFHEFVRYITSKPPSELAKDSIYGDTLPTTDYVEEVKQELEKEASLEEGKTEKDMLESCFDEGYIPVRKHRERYSDIGELVIDRYLDRHYMPFDEVITVGKDSPAQTCILDIGVNYGDRRNKNVAEQHKKVYSLAAIAEATKKPFRVIATVCMDFPEMKNIKLFLILKDYNDPISPSLWSLLANNGLANSIVNCFSDYIMGTRDGGNGRCVKNALTPKILGDSDVIVLPPSENVYWTEQEEREA